MANVTRIKAKDDGPKKDKELVADEEVTRKVTVKAKNSENKKAKAKAAAKVKEIEKREKKAAEKGEKKVFILFRPFVAFGRYIRDSFREVRQVRWPDRKSTWKMTLSVIVFVLLMAGFIMLLDALFTFLFNKLLGGM